MSAEAKIRAYLTVDDDGDPAMLFFDRQEAMGYCAEGEEPVEMVPRAELDRLRAEVEGYRVDAERWRYAVAIGGNQRMNWLDVYDDWDGDGDFVDALDSARSKEE